jgi:hypothetical protein
MRILDPAYLQRMQRRATALREAPRDRWVALAPDETHIIADGGTFAEVCANAEAVGVADPIIVKLSDAWIEGRC